MRALRASGPGGVSARDPGVARHCADALALSLGRRCAEGVLLAHHSVHATSFAREDANLASAAPLIGGEMIMHPMTPLEASHE